MELIRPTDGRYDELRTVFNAAIDRSPAVIARCATPDDVADALRLARDGGLAVAVRAGRPLGRRLQHQRRRAGGRRPADGRHPGRPGRADRHGRRRRHLGRVRPGDPGARAGDHGRTGLHDRRGRADPRRRLGLAGAAARADLRQPPLGRPGDGGRRAGHRQRDGGAGPVLGAARRRRQLRRRHVVHLRPAPARPDGARRPAAVAGQRRPRPGAGLPRPDGDRGRPAGQRPGLPHRPAGAVRARAPAGDDGRGDRPDVGGGRRRRHGGDPPVPRAAARGRPRRADAVRRTSSA